MMSSSGYRPVSVAEQDDDAFVLNEHSVGKHERLLGASVPGEEETAPSHVAIQGASVGAIPTDQR